MLFIFLTALITFFVASLFGYVVHKALHSSWTGRFNNAHMTHHLRLYPPQDYLSDKYRNAGKDNTVLIFGAAAIPLVAIPIVLGVLHFVPWTLSITSLLIMLIMSFLHSYLHDAFHIRNHWLYRIPLINKMFKRWVHIHWLHHVDQKKNYGIFLFFLDRLFGTYWDD
jgi:sterol desaturase/sphingolipid hydroxylase (fatty acid hydroxylase superfamily)